MNDHNCSLIGDEPLNCRCNTCGRMRQYFPAPELPEGYRENDKGELEQLLDDEWELVAWFQRGRSLCLLDCKIEDAQALAIWLQRRAAKPPETGTQTSKESR